MSLWDTIVEFWYSLFPRKSDLEEQIIKNAELKERLRLAEKEGKRRAKAKYSHKKINNSGNGYLAQVANNFASQDLMKSTMDNKISKTRKIKKTKDESDWLAPTFKLNNGGKI